MTTNLALRELFQPDTRDGAVVSKRHEYLPVGKVQRYEKQICPRSLKT